MAFIFANRVLFEAGLAFIGPSAWVDCLINFIIIIPTSSNAYLGCRDARYMLSVASTALTALILSSA